MKAKSKRSSGKDPKERNYPKLPEGALSNNPFLGENRVDRLRRTFRCSLTRVNCSKERCFVI